MDTIPDFLAALKAMMNLVETLLRWLVESFNATSVLAIAAAVSAIAASITAYLNYRSRPILMRSVQRHSNDLRRIATEWAKQIPEAQRPDLTRSDPFDPWKEPVLLHLPIEDEFLFADIANHTPPEIPVLKTWSEYKRRLHAYDQARYELLMQIQDEILRRTGLPYDPRFHHGISEHGVRAIYESFFAEITDGSGYWKHQVEQSGIRQSREQFELWTSGEGLAAGSEAEVTQARLILIQMVSDLKGLVGDATHEELRRNAENLLREKQVLDKARGKLLREINDFLSIPIVPRTCKYIKWALAKT